MSLVLSSRSTSSVTSAQALPPAAFHPTRQDSLSTFSSSLMGHQDESSLLAPASPMQDFSQFGIQIHQSNGMDTNLTPTTDDDVLSTDYDFVFPAFHEGNDSAPAKIELFSPNAAFNLNTLNSSSNSQQPVAAIAVAHSSGAAASASAASANADKPVLALLPDVLSRGSSIFNAPVPIMANVSNLSTESFHSPNSHMTPLSTSSSSVSPKSDDDSPQTELHTIKPDSDSNSKASTRRRRIPHIRPAAVPVPVAVAAPILASGAAPVAAIATVKVRKRREVQRYDEETRAKTRLENHRRYDKRRRQAMHMIFAELKQVIHTSADLSKKSKTFIPQSDMLAVNNAAMSVVSVDDEDDEDSKKILKDLPNMTELENYSQHQLFSAAAASIRMLNGIREQLEKQIDNTESESAALDKKAKEDSMEAESTAVARAISAPVSDINTLLQAIAVVNRRYQLEVDAVRTIQSQLPLFINSLADYFPEFAVLGIDASVTSSVNFKFDGEFRDGYILARKCRAHDGIRVPFLAQVHQLCAYITKRFRYQDIAMVDVHSIDLRNYQSAEQVLQLFKESRDAPDTYLTDGKPTPNTIVHSQFLYPPAPSPLTAANLAASCPASSSSAAAAASGTVTPLILPEAQNHPLGQYAVDPESFRAIQDMLAFFVSLGPEQFDAKIFALVGASRDHFRVPEPSPTAQSMALSVDSHEWLPKALVHHPLFSPTYDQVQALHELYTGKKPVVRYRGQIMPSPGENALYMDSDMTLICHPSTGLPMAHLCLPRNMYYSKEKYKDIERRAFQRAGISEHESFFK